MRLDKFLKVCKLVKRRSVAKETADEGVISVNGRLARPSHALKVGDIIEIDMWNCYKKCRVLVIPLSNTIPKGSENDYVMQIEYRTKDGNNS
jgi:ribosomal 50S subunit-recycling heat shock protein